MKILRIPVLVLLLGITALSSAQVLTYRWKQFGRSRTGGTWFRCVTSNPTNRAVSFSLIVGSDVENQVTIPAHNIGPSETQTQDVLFKGDSYSGSLSAVEEGTLFSNLESADIQQSPRTLNVALVNEVPTTEEITDFGTGTVAKERAYSMVGTPTTITAEMVPLKSIAPGDLPTNWVYLTALQNIFISAEGWSALKEEQKDAVKRYAAWGGFAMIYNADENSSEPLGAGALIRSPGNPFKKLPHKIPEKWRWHPYSYETQSGLNYPAPLSTPPVPRNTKGRWGGLVLATLFLILVGPVNYAYFRRKNRIRMIAVSTPVISCAFCTLIIGYFLASQGFNRRISTLSLTTLDERRNEAFLGSVHSFFSGIYPLSGFHFSSETCILPLTGAADRGENKLRIEIDGDIHVTRGLVKSGNECTYATFLPYKTRERLVWDAQTQTAMNGFDLPAEKVFVETTGGLYAGGPAAAGEKVKLSHIDPPSADIPGGGPLMNATINHMPEKWRASFAQGLAPLADGVLNTSGTHYAMFFSADPPQATAGISRDAGTGIHVLVGLMNNAQPGRK